MRNAAAPIVVIDGNAHARGGLADAIRGHGVPVIEAADGAAALRLIRQAAPSGIFVDLDLPDMDGVEFMRRAGTLCRDAKIVAMSHDLAAMRRANEARVRGLRVVDKLLPVQAVAAFASRVYRSALGDGPRALAV